MRAHTRTIGSVCLSMALVAALSGQPLKPLTAPDLRGSSIVAWRGRRRTWRPARRLLHRLVRRELYRRHSRVSLSGRRRLFP